jgi:hypothetical protein
MTATVVETRQDILEIALNQAIKEQKVIKDEIIKINNQQALFNGTYGVFHKEKEQLKHSLFYHETALQKIHKTIKEITIWKEELK